MSDIREESASSSSSILVDSGVFLAPPTSITFVDEYGGALVRIHSDGRVDYDGTPGEAAALFWASVTEHRLLPPVPCKPVDGHVVVGLCAMFALGFLLGVGASLFRPHPGLS